MKTDNILQAIGNTPHIRTHWRFGPGHQVWTSPSAATPADRSRTASPVIPGGARTRHPIQRIGAGSIPTKLQKDLLNGVIQVDAEPAREIRARPKNSQPLMPFRWAAP